MGVIRPNLPTFHRQHDFGIQWSLICWGALFTDKPNRTLDEAMVFSMGNPPPVLLRFSPGIWRRAFIAFRIPPRFGKRRWHLNCWGLIWSGSCWKGVFAFAEKQTFFGFNLKYPEHIYWLKMHDYFKFILHGSVLWVSAGIRPAPTIISILVMLMGKQGDVCDHPLGIELGQNKMSAWMVTIHLYWSLLQLPLGVKPMINLQFQWHGMVYVIHL